ncbi:MAG: ParB N-terminal domain-containing protein [Phycisphaerales bacterium]|nr:ParB N-terminal domain-containing protein [Phycisphaerales bacterium]
MSEPIDAAPILLPPTSLTPHPKNEAIYTGSTSDLDLRESIQRDGILEPLVATSANVVLSGHRRLRVALDLKLDAVPVRRIDPRNEEDEVDLLVAFNTQRKKTATEIYNEAMVLKPYYASRAAERQAEGRRAGAAARHGKSTPDLEPRRRMIDDLAAAIGVKREMLRRIMRVHEAIEGQTAPQRVLEELNEGRLSVHEAYRRVRRCQRLARRREAMDRAIESGDFNYEDELEIQPFDVWEFRRRDNDFHNIAMDGDVIIEGSYGSPPAQLIAHALAYWTKPGDMVVDPMAGRGQVERVARAMRRRAVSFDLVPRADFVAKLDAMTGPPPECPLADLVFLDPPYGLTHKYSKDPRDLSRCVSEDAWLGAVLDIARRWMTVIKPGGRMIVLIGSEYRRKRDQMMDRAWAVGRGLETLGRIERRVQIPYATSMFDPRRTAHAIEHRWMLSRIRELFVIVSRESSS